MPTKGDRRRRGIYQELCRAEGPVMAKDLASKFGVSRQVIVQDIAVLRASNANIISTYRGYVMEAEPAIVREFKVRHTPEQVQDELNAIVDCGGKVLNVSVSHRVYGRITADMDISSRLDVQEFCETLKGSSSSLLSGVTSGYHYHLVEAPSEQRLDLIEERLREAGMLVPRSPDSTGR